MAPPALVTMPRRRQAPGRRPHPAAWWRRGLEGARHRLRVHAVPGIADGEFPCRARPRPGPHRAGASLTSAAPVATSRIPRRASRRRHSGPGRPAPARSARDQRALSRQVRRGDRLSYRCPRRCWPPADRRVSQGLGSGLLLGWAGSRGYSPASWRAGALRAGSGLDPRDPGSYQGVTGGCLGCDAVVPHDRG